MRCDNRRNFLRSLFRTLTLPHLDKSLCIGCGGCEYICPVLPHKAIYVEGLSVQTNAKEPERGKEESHKVDDFGF